MTDVVVVGEMISDVCSKLEAQLLDYGVKVIASSEHVDDILPLLEKHQPRVVVMDFAERAQVSLGLIRLINIKNPGGKVLLISNFTDEDDLMNGITVGAQGYLEREACGIFLTKAIEAVALGEAWLSRKMVAKLLERLTEYSERTEAEQERVIYTTSSLLH